MLLWPRLKLAAFISGIAFAALWLCAGAPQVCNPPGVGLTLRPRIVLGTMPDGTLVLGEPIEDYVISGDCDQFVFNLTLYTTGQGNFGCGGELYATGTNGVELHVNHDFEIPLFGGNGPYSAGSLVLDGQQYAICIKAHPAIAWNQSLLSYVGLVRARYEWTGGTVNASFPFALRSPILGDINRDLAVDADDLVLLLGAWGAHSSNVNGADFNLDHQVNIDDLVTLIRRWTH